MLQYVGRLCRIVAYFVGFVKQSGLVSGAGVSAWF